MPSPRIVYLLRCPHSGDVRYVGVTRCPKQRQIYHRSTKRSRHLAVDDWTSQLAEQGTPAEWEPVLAISAEHAGMATYIEEAVISHMRNRGCNLLNADIPSIKRRKRPMAKIDQSAVALLLGSLVTQPTP